MIYFKTFMIFFYIKTIDKKVTLFFRLKLVIVNIYVILRNIYNNGYDIF